jgi:CheY-like chemotaxis protein
VIRVLSVDDHPLLREGIAALIGSEEDMELVGEASNGREALDLFRKHRPARPTPPRAGRLRETRWVPVRSAAPSRLPLRKASG